MNKNHTLNKSVTYFIILFLGVVLLYPIIWMFMATFKSNDEIFGSTKLLPDSWSLNNYIAGWKGSGDITYTQFFINTFLMVVPTTVFTVMSAVFVAYGFTRFNFRFKKLFFMFLLAMMMLPNAVVIVPRYILYNQFHWVDSYIPFYAPAILCCNSFFPYMLIQFLRGIPKELDESAYIDGCGHFRILVQIIVPLMKPAIFSCGLFQFLWTYNDYFNPLIFVNSVKKYPLSLALRMSLDAESIVQWGKVMAMSTVAVIPVILLYFTAQKYFVEGMATSGLKG